MTQAIRDHKKLILTLLSGALLLILAVVYIFPFFHMFSTSLKTFAEANMMPPKLLPEEPQFQNYAEAWDSMNVLHYLKNSVIITGCHHPSGRCLSACPPPMPLPRSSSGSKKS